MSSIRPDFSNRSEQEELSRAYPSARAALVAGDNECALVKAGNEKDAATFGASLIMCGAVDYGLKRLRELGKIDDEIKLYQAYGFWCQNRKEQALGLLSEIRSGEFKAQSECLAEFIERQDLKVLFICNRSSAPEILEDSAGDISFLVALVDEAGGTGDMGDIIPRGFEPDLLIVNNVGEEELPGGFFASKIANSFYIGDLDYGLVSQFGALENADMIICNSMHEHRYLRELYDGRITSFPTFGPYMDSTRFQQSGESKVWDIFFSGNCFVSHMGQKARFAFRLATLDDPRLNIRIHDGYLERGEFTRIIGRSKFVPMNVRWTGLLQTRAVDAVRFGAMNLHARDVPADLLLEDAGLAFHAYSEASFESDILHHIANHDRYRAALEPDLAGVESEFMKVFPPSPGREIRQIKFCLFQQALQSAAAQGEEPERKGKGRRSASGRTTRETVSPINKKMADFRPHSDSGQVDLINLTAAAFEIFCRRPSDAKSSARARESFELSRALYPRSLVLAFNHACFLWVRGERRAALGEFGKVSDLCRDGEFDPSRQNLLGHLWKPLQEFLPYQMYFEAVVDDLRGGDGTSQAARNVLQATAQTYLAADDLEAARLEACIGRSRQAMDLCAAHFPAARLLTKALFANGAEADEAAAWFYRTINLFPLYLSELLPIGVALERTLGRADKALEILKIWALFMIRVEWQRPDQHPVPSETWEELKAHLEDLPDYIQTGLKRKFAEIG